MRDQYIIRVEQNDNVIFHGSKKEHDKWFNKHIDTFNIGTVLCVYTFKNKKLIDSFKVTKIYYYLTIVLTVELYLIVFHVFLFFDLVLNYDFL